MEPFFPVIEPYVTEQCFIPKDPLLMAREAWGNNIDTMFMGCSNEGLFSLLFFAKFGEEFYNELSIERFLGTELGLAKGDPKRKIYGDEMTELYCGTNGISTDNLQGYVDVTTSIGNSSIFFKFFYSSFQTSIFGMESIDLC